MAEVNEARWYVIHTYSGYENKVASDLEKIIENLVSNAVKYTPENGTVKITADKKQLIVSNTVKEKIDTKELKTPFVRGDKSRSNTDGCGLGLSIAERAAAVNGFKLNVRLL